MLDRERAAALVTWAAAAARARGDGPPSPTAVAEQIAALAARHGKAPAVPATATIHPAHPPEALTATICRLFSCSKHRLANPLTACTAVHQYWGDSSAADQWFGCSLGAYNGRWTGASVCTPPWDFAECSKAVAWALASARAAATDGGEEPTLTILVLPDAGSSPAFAQHMLAHASACRRLLRVPRRHARLMHAGKGRAGTFQATRPRWPLQVVAIGNAAGFARFAPTADTQAWLDAARPELAAALGPMPEGALHVEWTTPGGTAARPIPRG
jgi:hypothetical protein